MYILDEMKVVDMSTFVAAPTCGRFLSDMGAKVLKIESKSKDPMRRMGAMVGLPIENDENPGFDMMNSGKSSVQLDLKLAEDKDILFNLLEHADVFITNTREVSLKKLGLDYSSLKDKFPQLIYAHMTAYGEKGRMSNQPGYDFTAYYARSGISGTLYEKGTSPLITVPAFGDLQAGLFLAAGVLAAYIGKLRSGLGTKVSNSLLSTGVYGMSYMIAAAQYGLEYPIKRTDNINPLQCIYETKDGRWIQVAFAVYEDGVDRFYKAIEREDLLFIPEYKEYSFVKKNSSKIINLIQNEILKKNLNQWINIFRKYDIPCDPLQLWEEVAKDDQVLDNGYLQELKYKDKLINMPTCPIKLTNYKIKNARKGPTDFIPKKEIVTWFLSGD